MLKKELCCCSDPGCTDDHLTLEACGRQAERVLVRVDDGDREPLPFCDGCADDALSSGIFSEAVPTVYRYGEEVGGG